MCFSFEERKKKMELFVVGARHLAENLKGNKLRIIRGKSSASSG